MSDVPERLDPQGWEARRRVFVRVALVGGGFIALHTVGQLVLPRLLAGPDGTAEVLYPEPAANAVSIGINVALIALLAALGERNRRAARDGRPAGEDYRRSAWVGLTATLAWVLGHMHLAGSQSNPNSVLLVVVVALAHRLLGNRAAWSFLALAFTSWAGLTWLEQRGVLAYAPLHRHGAHLAHDFLSGGQALANLLTVGLISLFMVDFLVRIDRRRSEAHTEIERLQELLRMCAYCKRVYDDDQGWMSPERKLAAAGPVTHGICPDCERELREEL